MRVLHVFGALDVGGAEMRTLEAMELAASRGVVSDFAALSGREGVMSSAPQAWGGREIPCPLGPLWAVRFLDLCRGYDVVHSHVATFSGPVLTLARLAGVPVRIAHFRSDGDRTVRWAKKLQWTISRSLIRLSATHVLGVSPGSLEGDYRADWPSDPRAEVLPNGLRPSVEEAGARAQGGLHLINVGRPFASKRRAFLADVVQALREGNDAPTLTVVGKEGHDTEQLSSAARQAGWADRLVVTGPRQDVRALLAASTVTVFPSTLEGLPGVVLESLFEGTPVVAVDLPGARYIKAEVPKAPLVLLPAEADAREWAQAVRSAQGLVDRRDASRRAMEDSVFDLDRSVDRLLEIYAGRR